ncbi:unnamed protein product [Leptosia nina]|uniref:Protein-lysine N-methyltransferase SMYD4 n=1 Tax=Leptosia nina TaxID=320188 RepID=A0AAV1K5J7_9NEOP
MIIDLVYEGALKKLTELGKIVDVSNELKKKVTNADRVMYVYKIFEEYNFFPSTLEVMKSVDVSGYYRNQGNKCYTKKNFYRALQYYNLSLLHAPFNSENYLLSLSNRSAVFYELQKYDECIQDIDLCSVLQCSEKLREKLGNRKDLCLKFLKNETTKDPDDLEALDILSMKADHDKQYVSASSKLQVVCSKDMGRHVIAKEDINVGEVLADEEPYVSLILQTHLLFACNHCFSRKPNLVPCEHCCFALYCSKQCATNAWNEYHSVECVLLPTLLDMSFTKLELLAFRIVIKARNDHTDWKSFFQTIMDAESKVGTDLHGHVKVGENWIYDSKYYVSIHTLATNIDKRSVSDIFQKAVTAAVLLKFLLDKTTFMDADNDDQKTEVIQCVAGLLLLHIMTSPTNMHGISTNTDLHGDGKYVSKLDIGSAPFAFHSLINHSCAPNVVRFCELDTSKMKLFALRPIKKGMQLFDNYGSHHALEGCRERRASLHFQYKFICTCEACQRDWPTYLTMRPKRISHKIARAKSKYLNADIIEKLQVGDRDTAIKIYNKLCNLCEELESYVPCIELCESQEALKQCLAIFCGSLPHGYNETVDWKVQLNA